eukprot:4314639-Alexandrium_andersonii.AAC.1
MWWSPGAQRSDSKPLKAALCRVKLRLNLIAIRPDVATEQRTRCALTYDPGRAEVCKRLTEAQALGAKTVQAR